MVWGPESDNRVGIPDLSTLGVTLAPSPHLLAPVRH